MHLKSVVLVLALVTLSLGLSTFSFSTFARSEVPKTDRTEALHSAASESLSREQLTLKPSSLSDSQESFLERLTSESEASATLNNRRDQFNAESLRNRFELTPDSSRNCRFASGIGLPPPANTVVLTFDDGPSPALLPHLLNVLEKYSIQATFFWTGKMARGNERFLDEATRRGHLVANHSYSHPNFHVISENEQSNQIGLTDQILGRHLLSGQKYFRYPYGNSTCHSNEVLRQAGYQIVGWHVDSCDWAFASSGRVTESQAKICAVKPENTHNFVEHVVSSVQKRTGGILLFHDVHSRTIQNLETIIVRLRQQGYQFVSLSDPRYRPHLR